MAEKRLQNAVTLLISTISEEEGFGLSRRLTNNNAYDTYGLG